MGVLRKEFAKSHTMSWWQNSVEPYFILPTPYENLFERGSDDINELLKWNLGQVPKEGNQV